MLKIKGFCTHALQVDNTPGVVATFGELSTYARTYARDIGIYTSSSYAGIEFNCFRHAEGNTPQGKLTADYYNVILQVTQWIYNRATSISNTIVKNDYVVDMQTAFAGVINTVDIGTIKYDGTNTIPEWFKFAITGKPSNEVKVWLSSNAFEVQYDEFEIVVVNPLDNIDILFNTVSKINEDIQNNPSSKVMQKVVDAKNKAPETFLRIETVTYVNPQNTDITVNIDWYVLIYGVAGDNPEEVKTAIINYILSHSTEDENAWKQVLPYLFKNTRMYILPMWSNMAIPNRVSTAGIYSPISNANASLTYAKATLAPINNTFVTNNLEITHHKYRAITLLCCGDPDNVQSKFKLSDYMPDYIAESSTSQDFNRMAETTKQWTIDMERMLVIAENINEYPQLPSDIRKTVLNNITYVTKEIARVQYLVAVREIS